MLIIANKIHQLRFSQLMDVYLEGNTENGREFWPELSEGEQLQRAEQDFYNYLHDVFFAAPGSFYCIWEDAGSYVSALRLEPYKDGLLLEALETAPDRRRNGFAATLLSAVRGYLADQGGAKVYSHVGKRNEASLAVHQKAGFHRISEQAVYVDGSVNNRCCTLCIEI